MTEIERAIDVLENGVTWDEGYDSRQVEDACDLAISALKEKQERRWIPVSERLPKEKGEYLVSFYPCWWDDVKVQTCVGTDTFRGKSSWAKKKFQRVIAWQPLPEPWEGE